MAETALTHTVKSFRWSEKEYEPREILDRFGHLLPIVIVVTQGHLGKDEGIHTLGSDEMYYLHEVVFQARVVVTDEQNRYFSIPLCYEEEVIPTKSNGQEDQKMTVKKMVERGTYQFFRFFNNPCHTVCRGADIDDYIKLGRLEIMDTYDERFLSVHTILTVPSRPPPIHMKPQPYIQDGLNPAFSLLPVYMPIALAVAMDTVNNTNRRFHRTMLKFKKYVEQQPHNYEEMLKEETEIMVFDQKPSDGDYEYIHLLQFIQPEPTVEQAPSKKPVLAPEPSGPAPTRPPKSNAMSQKAAKNKYGVFSKLLPKKKKDDQHGELPPPLPDPRQTREPPPIPETDSDDSYEEIPEGITPGPQNNQSYSNIDVTPLKDRTGPVALGWDPESVLEQLHKVTTDGFIPGYENYVCDLNPKPPPSPPAEPMHMRPRLPSREPIIDSKLCSALHPHNKPRSGPTVPTRSVPAPDDNPVDTSRKVSVSEAEHLDKGQSPPGHKQFGFQGPLGDENIIEAAKNKLKPTQRQQGPPDRRDQPVRKLSSGSATIQEKATNSTRTPIPNPLVQERSHRVTPNDKSSPATVHRKEHIPEVNSQPARRANNQYKATVHKESTPASAAAATPGVDSGLPHDVTSVSQIPKDLSSFTVTDVAECLRLLNMQEYAPTFTEHQIDGEFLPNLDLDILLSTFNFDKLKAMKLLKFISGWRPKL